MNYFVIESVDNSINGNLSFVLHIDTTHNRIVCTRLLYAQAQNKSQLHGAQQISTNLLFAIERLFLIFFSAKKSISIKRARCSNAGTENACILRGKRAIYVMTRGIERVVILSNGIFNEFAGNVNGVARLWRRF